MSIKTMLVSICALPVVASLVFLMSLYFQLGSSYYFAVLLLITTLLPLVYSARVVSRRVTTLASKYERLIKPYGNGDSSYATDEFGRLNHFASVIENQLTSFTEKVSTAQKEIESIQSSCDTSIRQAREASRLAEESRGSNLLSASSKLENAVKRILLAAGELSNRMESISSGADIQRERMNETSGSMSEMNLAILDISKSSSDASVSIGNAKEQARSSAKIAADTRASISNVNKTSEILKLNMGNLSQQAQGIDDIINVITEIADQTNLLALNAAIEAARAGDAGRGFAVVADEVRKLAEKTMTATKEVSDSIVSIQNAINQNVEEMNTAVAGANEAALMAERAGESAGIILEHIEDNASKILSIATASEEQSASSDHINKAIAEVESVASEIADGIHESSQSVLELSDLANELSGLIEDLKAAMQPDVLMPWTSELENGIRFVDEQHKVLVDMINSLYVAMKGGQGRSLVEGLLDKLVQYTIYHFGNEEKYFDQFKFSETVQHKKYHKELTDQVIKHVEQFKTGKVDISMELMHFLKKWLSNHICQIDKRYVKTFLDGGLEPTRKNRLARALHRAALT